MTRTPTRHKTRRQDLRFGFGPRVASGLLASFLLVQAMPAAAETDPLQGTWNPVASEKLIKLPGSYLKKAVENDFSNSSLAAAIQDIEISMGLKAQTLSDLQSAIEQSSGDLKVEIRHQFLAEKREYLELVGRHQELRREQIETKASLYERLLGKLKREDREMTPARQELVEKQEAARHRFETSVSKVDLKMFSTPMVSESKYHKEYSKNVVAIERLVQAIQSHPMNAQSQIGGQPVTKEEFLRQMVADSQAELSIIDQEETMLGYMAKLISLDALALTEALTEENGVVAEEDQTTSGIASAVNFFVPDN